MNPDQTRLGRKNSTVFIACVVILICLGSVMCLLVLGSRKNQPKPPDFAGTVRQLVADPIQFATNRLTGGIGAAIDVGSGFPVVRVVIPGSPAEKAGLKNGDILLEIGKVSTKGQTLPQVVNSIRGLTASSVSLLIQRKGTNVECVLSRTSWNTLEELRKSN